MQNRVSTTFQHHSNSVNLAGRRRDRTSRFARLGRHLNSLAAALLAITISSASSADDVTRWNQIATDASTVADTNPLK